MSLAAATAVTITLLHFSDYHSHAVPFYSEDAPDQGGLARAIALLKAGRARSGTFVVSGGDMLNRGTPAWSDEHGCVEWAWLAGLVDAMALGNHDLDYGAEAFERCRAAASFPILSANLVRADGSPYLTTAGKPYVVKEHAGVRVGFFALGGPDVQKLVRAEDLPTGTRWTDATATAREVVRALREDERVAAVVLIGHQTRAEDEALARAAPGIDVILGTHSHLRVPLDRIGGTQTYYVAPFQYLAYVAEVRLGFEGRPAAPPALMSIGGGLLKMDRWRAEDPAARAEVERLQRDLERRRPERFQVLGNLERALSDTGVTEGESELGNWATDRLRAAAGAHAFFSTASSFRAALPPGPLTLEGFLTALPYENEIVTGELSGALVNAWLDLVASRRGSDFFSQTGGVRYRLDGGRASDIEVLQDADDAAKGFAPLRPTATYRVATTDYQAFVALGYRELFAAAASVQRTGLDVQRVLMDSVRAGDTRGVRDGRVR
ncbi:MAG TPA: bifunctional UDP-sugar hydrolase/5'-nucleotidase [Vicinamibacteria bacterium]|nr:bifunctional UDP-sugar hydrolase/5'-nucleotidase [Vicinamibacteria bacterium]